jgi:AraC family transcriptional activator of tynA and feaB
VAFDLQPWPGAGGLPITGERAWLDAVNSGFLQLEIRSSHPREFAGRIDSHALGDKARAALVSSAAHEVKRTSLLAEQSDHNYIKALWLTQGRCEVEQGKNRSVLEGGQWAVYETGRPYGIRFSDEARFAVALLPIEACAEWSALGREMCARAFCLDAASRGALYTLLSTFESSCVASAAGLDAIGRAMGLMVNEALRMQAAAFMPADRLERRLRDLRRLVDARLDDPALGPQELADGLHMSLRALYSLFRQIDTTPASFIQGERLERCRRALADPAESRRTITEVAHANGFTDSAHFSRIFKARYGITASEWRQRQG